MSDYNNIKDICNKILKTCDLIESDKENTAIIIVHFGNVAIQKLSLDLIDEVKKLDTSEVYKKGV